MAQKAHFLMAKAMFLFYRISLYAFSG